MTVTVAPDPPAPSAPTGPDRPQGPDGPETGLPLRLGVVPWPAESDSVGHDPRSAYVETFWLPLLGPSTTLVLRGLAERLDDEPEGFEVDTAMLSREVGLGELRSRRRGLERAIKRAERFAMVSWRGDILQVRTRLNPVHDRRLERISPRLAALHRDWSIDPATDGAARRTELVRAAHLARTLLSLGEPPLEIERQLRSWKFDSAIAWHALRWAEADDVLPVDPTH